MLHATDRMATATVVGKNPLHLDRANHFRLTQQTDGCLMITSKRLHHA